MVSSEVVLEGFHGTSVEGAGSIVNSTYQVVPSPEDWLGTGVYFFVDGISCPRENAAEWARNKFHLGFAVVRSLISVPRDKVLDLTSAAGLSKYNNARVEFIEQNKLGLFGRRDLTLKKRRDIRLDDRIVTEAVLAQLGAKVLIHNVYIKSAVQRELILESSYPNVTVCSVSDLSCIKCSEILDSKSFKVSC
ncbi:hypothetical protein [Pseudomonas sp. TWP3-1]|uniref:hypothetical protein n=1 Tax=Pseudomonas sp. TWP3-1 TaxID=2804631 RepID=UPI003CE82C1D